MDLNKDYYKILGISDKNCTSDTIKSTYRNLAKTHHPDKTDNKDDTMFKSINEAYEVLGTDVARKQYDTQSKFGNSFNPMSDPFSFLGGFGPFAPGGPFGGIQFQQQAGTWCDFISNINGNFFHREEFHENLDVGYLLSVSLKDVYNNEQLKIKFNRNIKCDECDWTGFDLHGTSFECETCDGKGHYKGRTCEYCRGTGIIHTGTCSKCNGNKVIRKEEEFVLSNSHSINGSFNKYLKGYGHQSKHYRNKIGNLTIEIVYNHDNNYQIVNKDLIYKIDIHYQHAIDGFDFDYEHLDGKKYKIKIPEKTKDGDMLKIDDKGLIIDDSLKRGNLLFKVNIIIDYSLLEVTQ